MGRYRGSVKDGKIVAADVEVAAMPSFKELLGAHGHAADGLPTANWPWASGHAVRHPELSGVQLRGAGRIALHHLALGRRFGQRLFHESFIDELSMPPASTRSRRASPCARSRSIVSFWKRSARWPTGRARSVTEGRGVAFVEAFATAVAEIIEVTMTDVGIRSTKAGRLLMSARSLIPLISRTRSRGASSVALVTR